jgi:hypothetical protein
MFLTLELRIFLGQAGVNLWILYATYIPTVGSANGERPKFALTDL